MIEQMIEFAGNNMLLVAAWFIAASFLVINLTADNKNNILPSRATEMINHDDAIVVDVRPAADFNKGHIINAINIPANTLTKQMSMLSKYQNKPIIVSCRSGAQSSVACRQLKKAGYENVFNLKGGILSWQSDNLPVSTKKKK